MNYLEKVEHWGDAHHPKWLDIVRIALGVFLCYKGIDFLRNMAVMSDLLSHRMAFGSFSIIMIGHFIVFAHILGGILIAIGVLTRFACLIQIPILLGAVILILFNSSDAVLRPYSEGIISVVVLLLLIYFLIVGNGPLHFDFEEAEEKPSTHRY
jgi:uncharacterized membrane protein YphA (DoxX/SURF4 family)